MPENEALFGKSRLGGLSLNASSGKQFVNQMAAALGVPPEIAVDGILHLVSQGMLPKRQIQQIRQTLLAERIPPPFAMEAGQLDSENFGNAITPNFTDFAYLETGGKYLTRDSLHVYTRVPSANVESVTFNLRSGTGDKPPIKGTRVTPGEFQADTIPYTFRLEETLAATNLPAWPSLDNQLFSAVDLRYSQTGPKGPYDKHSMSSVNGKNGVVWEIDIDIPAGRTVYYYFEVTLTEPVGFTTLSREQTC